MSELHPTPEVMEFTARMAAVHPELSKPVVWTGFMAIAHRCKIAVRVLNMSHPARLVRLGTNVGIQIKRGLDRTLQCRYGMHELWKPASTLTKQQCFIRVKTPRISLPGT
jgi:hypothetical protein